MKKTLLLLLVVFSFMLVSCSNNDNHLPVTTTGQEDLSTADTSTVIYNALVLEQGDNRLFVRVTELENMLLPISLESVDFINQNGEEINQSDIVAFHDVRIVCEGDELLYNSSVVINCNTVILLDDSTNDVDQFIATVLENKNNHLLVSPDEDSINIDPAYVPLNNVLITNDDGEILSSNQIEPGMKIKVLYSFIGLNLFECYLIKLIDAEPINVSLTATVLEKQNNDLLVTPDNKIDQIVVAVSNASIIDQDERVISLSQIEPGMKIKILYNGLIAETYPGQINHCFGIQIIDDEQIEVKFTATVLENNHNNLLVEPDIGSFARNSADQIFVYINGTFILDENESLNNVSLIEVGDTIEILYNGLIAESYPAQIQHCFKIKIINEDK